MVMVHLSHGEDGHALYYCTVAPPIKANRSNSCCRSIQRQWRTRCVVDSAPHQFTPQSTSSTLAEIRVGVPRNVFGRSTLVCSRGRGLKPNAYGGGARGGRSFSKPTVHT
ncbi:unnamed protein product [Ectocarpus fasciculatus]